MILFLDFDGVLHPYPTLLEPMFFRTNLLWEILRVCPNVAVVFSTSWREEHSLEYLVDFVTYGGGEDLAHRFIGCTTNIEHEGYYGRRDLEIQYWLDANCPNSDWLALDDMPELFFDPDTHSEDGLHSNLKIINYRTGLTKLYVQTIIRILQ